MRINRTRSVAGVAVGLSLIVLAVSACGDDAPDEPVTAPETTAESEEPAPATAEAPTTEAPATTEAPTTEAPATTEAPTNEAPASTEAPAADDPAAEPPQAIISLSPTATEMLYAIGAGDQVLAVDDFSNYPPEAADKMQGLSGYTPNVEAIVGLEPDLVVTDGTNPDLIEQLEALGVAHWEGFAATSFDDVYSQIEQLGAITGHIAEAAALVKDMETEVEEIKAGLPELEEPLTYYHELDNTFFSVTSDTFIGAVYDEVGLVNIADAVGEGNPYPQLSAEFIIAEDPDLIFLACTKYCGETAETVAAREGWDSLTAVQTGGVIEMDDDIASRWGPRIVDYLRIVGDAVAARVELQGAA